MSVIGIKKRICLILRLRSKTTALRFCKIIGQDITLSKVLVSGKPVQTSLKLLRNLTLDPVVHKDSHCINWLACLSDS